MPEWREDVASANEELDQIEGAIDWEIDLRKSQDEMRHQWEAELHGWVRDNFGTQKD